MAMQGIKMTASAEEPAVAGSPSVAGSVVDPPPSSTGDEREHHEGAFLGGEQDDLWDGDYNYFSSNDDEDYYGLVDSDSEFEEDDELPNGILERVTPPAVCTFLGQPAWIAAVQSTVCFVTLSTSSAPPCQCQHCYHGGGDGGEIIVDYRYTRFSRTQQSGGDDDGIHMHGRGPKQARLRFVLPCPLVASDSDPVTTIMTVSSSLQFAGAVVASLVYPPRFSAQLQALWSVATAMPWRVPAQVSCLLVTVDVGILRPGDFTAERMWRMCEAVKSVAYCERAAAAAAVAKAEAPYFNIAAQLRLPAVLRSEDDVRPAKRRRVTAEDCPICCEVLEERGGLALAAWLRCSHIFHAGCLEQHLLRGFQECPLCRSELNLSPAPQRSELKAQPPHVENEF